MAGGHEFSLLTARGLSFTTKFMEIVGSEIFWKGMASGALRSAEGISDMKVRDAGDGHNGTDGGGGNLHLI